MAFDTLPDGRIVFPQQGHPPKAPYGYDPDPGDPWMFTPVYDKCDHRTTANFVKPCGKLAGRPWCKLKDCEAGPAKCGECDDIVFTGDEDAEHSETILPTTTDTGAASLTTRDTQ